MARADTRGRRTRLGIGPMRTRYDIYEKKNPTTDQQVQQIAGEELLVCTGVNNVYTERNY
jgi:hypothetical protein